MDNKRELYVAPRALRISMLLIGVVLGGTTQQSLAQTPDQSSLQALQALIPQVEVGPDTLAFDDATQTTTLTLVNDGAKAAEIWLGVACSVTEPADPLVAIWRNAYPCAMPWITGIPQHLVLAPQEQRELSVKMVPPLTFSDGQYSARIIWTTPFVQTSPTGDTLGVGMLHNNVTILYHKGPQTPRRARTRWSATVPKSSSANLVQAPATPLVFDDSTRTVTFTLRNPGATPQDVWLNLDSPWFQVNNVNYPESSQYESAWHNRIPNAVLWLSGYPQHLVLAPHEQRKIPVFLFPAPRLPVGNYYARIRYTQSPVLSIAANGDTTYATPQGAINVVYHRGPKLLPLTLNQLHATRTPNGAWQGCVTVQQQGIGVVATLHAEVDDAEGHRVRALTSSGGHPSNSRLPRAWALDTTVSVWEVVHHDPLDTSVDGTEKAPDPVCFALPTVPPGHYQLVVTAMTLDDVAGQHSVRTEVPLDIQN